MRSVAPREKRRAFGRDLKSPLQHGFAYHRHWTGTSSGYQPRVRAGAVAHAFSARLAAWLVAYARVVRMRWVILLNFVTRFARDADVAP